MPRRIEIEPDPETMDGPLLFARVIDARGGVRVIGWAEAQCWQPQAADEMLWAHLCRNRAGVDEWLESLAISEPTARALVSESTRPRAFREGDSLVATLRGVNVHPAAEPGDMVSLQLWATSARVVTLRRRALHTPREVLATIDTGQGPRDAGRLVTELVEALIARMNGSIVDMNEAIDAMEAEGAEADAQEMLAKIAVIRRNCLGLQRHMAPQHEALEAIARSAPDWFALHDRREIAESIDRLRRYLEDINISKESALVLQDDIRARAVARSERTSYLLTLVAAVFLPLGFFTGLLGVNVGGMPWTDDPLGFVLVISLCLVILLVQVALFRKWKWL